MNKAQRLIVLAGAMPLLFLLLVPPWEQAPVPDMGYRKEIGRGFILHPPPTVAVADFLPGAKTAPASYFRAVINERLYLHQSITLLCVILIGVFLFRQRADGIQSTIASWKTRLLLSALVALAVPTFGANGLPLASMLALVPVMIAESGELGSVYAVFVLTEFAGFVALIFLLLTLLVRVFSIPKNTQDV